MALGFHRPFPALIQRRIPSSRDFSVLDGLRFRDRTTFNMETLVKQFVFSGGKQLPFNCAMLNETTSRRRSVRRITRSCALCPKPVLRTVPRSEIDKRLVNEKAKCCSAKRPQQLE